MFTTTTADSSFFVCFFSSFFSLILLRIVLQPNIKKDRSVVTIKQRFVSTIYQNFACASIILLRREQKRLNTKQWKKNKIERNNDWKKNIFFSSFLSSFHTAIIKYGQWERKEETEKKRERKIKILVESRSGNTDTF